VARATLGAVIKNLPEKPAGDAAPALRRIDIQTPEDQPAVPGVERTGGEADDARVVEGDPGVIVGRVSSSRSSRGNRFVSGDSRSRSVSRIKSPETSTS